MLKPTGTLWLVIGDKYDDGQQLGLPWRVALALIDDGWILRADCIWHKPNAMPQLDEVAADDRPRVRLLLHEVAGLLLRRRRHPRAARDVQREEPDERRAGGTLACAAARRKRARTAAAINLHDGRWDQAFHPLGRNKRTVWSIPLSKFREAHFAVFPESLVETCILAGCPPGGLVLDPFLGSGTDRRRRPAPRPALPRHRLRGRILRNGTAADRCCGIACGSPLNDRAYSCQEITASSPCDIPCGSAAALRASSSPSGSRRPIRASCRCGRRRCPAGPLRSARRSSRSCRWSGRRS